MNLIAAVDAAWGIGLNNRLLVSVPEDMAFFRKKTIGSVVVMGRKTLESFPKGEPLKGRHNIVFSRDRSYEVKGASVVNTVGELLKEAETYDGNDIFVIGGGSIYRLLLPYCDTAYITRIYEVYKSDTSFPDLDIDPEWTLTLEGEKKNFNGIQYSFNTYKRINT